MNPHREELIGYFKEGSNDYCDYITLIMDNWACYSACPYNTSDSDECVLAVIGDKVK